eukprot:SAG31_NODE_6265_length_2096_cov_1.728092_2_plen_177_part_00
MHWNVVLCFSLQLFPLNFDYCCSAAMAKMDRTLKLVATAKEVLLPPTPWAKPAGLRELWPLYYFWSAVQMSVAIAALFTVYKMKAVVERAHAKQQLSHEEHEAADAESLAEHRSQQAAVKAVDISVCAPPKVPNLGMASPVGRQGGHRRRRQNELQKLNERVSRNSCHIHPIVRMI